MSKRQMKSRIYYYFWSAMTISVFIGQLYVGTGYRIMSDSVNRLLRSVDGVLLDKDKVYPDYKGLI
ncbi:hypothetical protein CYXG_00112 [Synechococcus phage S-SSM4]|jgi:hypothetical protein|uniref:Uncharacterized protein n=1 Tax=Synechococcus phage S-SSM4 TaxID=536466 RepID=M1U9I6_9CAUD|nr:hypothetical protein CYXG_00112 [Synechococcus phage S-SSM4]AGG54176.1 hypothetical protein CYXG_00112 [Synechococcus phage S-SSM4]AGG54465.1 hypothetical protein CYWG_00181 [Cyanophage S-SSM6b]|tara:strand:- start:1228 stop:1425 length:198 start_codon:yes stop_codon:yes gene_type:complete